MLTHMVLFDFDDPADADEAVRRLRAMAPKVEVIESLEAGRNIVPTNRSYEVGLIVRLADTHALERYRSHPEHVPVVEFIRERASRSASVDFED